jgi:hypothetical protein
MNARRFALVMVLILLVAGSIAVGWITANWPHLN